MNKKFYIIKATSLKHYFQFSSQFLALKEINSNFQKWKTQLKPMFHIFKNDLPP